MKKILIAVIIIAVIAGMVGLNIYRNRQDAPGAPTFRGKAQEVEAAVIRKGVITSTVLITGSVREEDAKTVVSSGNMELLSVLVEKGDAVTKGDVLIVADTDDLEDELTQLRLNREIQALQLEKLRSVSPTASSAGARVSVELARLNLASSESFLENQKENYQKNLELFNEGIITKSEFDALKKAVEDAEQQVEVARLNLERSQTDLGQVRESNDTSSKSLEIDVQIQLKNLESLDMNIAKLERRLQDIYEDTLAPMSGVVADTFVESGELVVSGTPLVRIVDAENLMIEAIVREYDVRDMELDQDVVITGDAIPEDAAVTGKLDFIAPVASEGIISNKKTTGVEIRITIDEGLEYLKPGYTMDCEVTTEHLDDVVIANYSLLGGQGQQ